MYERVRKKVDFFSYLQMCLSLYEYQSKASRYRMWLTYLKNRITTNQNITEDSRNQEEENISIIQEKSSNHKRKQTEKGIKQKYKINGKVTLREMAAVSYLSIIALNVNGLSAPIERSIQSGLRKKKNPRRILQYAYKRPTLGQRTHKRLKVKGWKTFSWKWEEIRG